MLPDAMGFRGIWHLIRPGGDGFSTLVTKSYMRAYDSVSSFGDEGRESLELVSP